MTPITKASAATTRMAIHTPMYALPIRCVHFSMRAVNHAS